MKAKIFFSLIFVFIGTSIWAQTDTLKTYNMKAIVIKSGFVLEPKTIKEIQLNELEKSDVASISELAKFIPSVKMQTNSRGESLFYMRGANERQSALFFDGAALNIPWDNRIDLSMVPTSAIGGMNISRGIPSVIYGANALAGVFNIEPIAYNGKGTKKITLQLGENNYKKFSSFWLDGYKNFSFLGSVFYKKADGYNLSEDYQNKLNPEKERINSYSETFNAFAKATYILNNFSKLGLSFSFINAEKGVPPEMDVKKSRYWQYPKWQKFTTILNGQHRFGNNKSSILTYSFSYSRFNMKINQFKDISYSNIKKTQEDFDNTLTLRGVYTKLIGANSILKFAFNGYTTNHDETIVKKSSGKESKSEYSQNVFSFSSEYEFVTEKFKAILGIGLDGINTPEVGDNPSKDNEYDYGINSSFIYSVNRNTSFNLNFGRKTRFPSLRESYSTALGKFELNPNLSPESAVSVEFGADNNFENGNININFLLSYLTDGIVMKTLPSGKRMRINKAKIRTYGLEISSNYILNRKLTAGLNFSYLNAFAKNSQGEYKDTLEYRPKFVAGINLDYQITEAFDILAEGNFMGEEFAEQKGFEKLPNYFLLNLRVAYILPFKGMKAEVFVRANNLFDKLYYTQWGLPEAGKQFWAGFSVTF